MARYRSLPTNFLKDPDVMALSSGDTRLMLIGLVLNADDEGRGLAHAKLLGRELDYSVEQIEQALAEMEAVELVECYQVGRHRYYQLCHWQEWESLSRPTPSKYPAPPNAKMPEITIAQGDSHIPQENLGNFGEISAHSGKSQKTQPEGEGEDEREGEGKRREGEAEDETPHNLVHFPQHRNTTSNLSPSLPEKVSRATAQIARILNLPASEALTRIVEEYLSEPYVSLFGEADAAREYIDDPKRNKRKQRLSPAFFRRWLKREREDTLRRQHQLVQQEQATGTDHATPIHGKSGSSQGIAPPGTPPHGEDQYQDYVLKRTRALKSSSQEGGQP